MNSGVRFAEVRGASSAAAAGYADFPLSLKSLAAPSTR